MASKSDKLYGESPKLDRDEETGKVEVKKPAKVAEESEGQETEGMPVPVRHSHERREMHHRHTHEHLALHHKHQVEHSLHDEAGTKPKDMLHERHEREYKDMHQKHHSEMKALHARHEKELGGKEK